LFFINTPKQSTTEITLFELVFGRPAVMSMESAFPWPPSTPLTHEERVEMVSRWRKMARRLIIIRQKKSKINYDGFRKTDPIFQIGELVLIGRRLKTKNTTKKFIPRFVRPYQVYRKVSPTCYAVEDLPCFRRKRLWRRFNAHFSQIRRYSVRRETEWCPYSDEYEKCDDESDQIGITPNESRPIENQPYEPAASRINRLSPASTINNLCRNATLHLSLEQEERLDQSITTIISFIINTRCADLLC
jgi:hypothetical protein